MLAAALVLESSRATSARYSTVIEPGSGVVVVVVVFTNDDFFVVGGFSVGIRGIVAEQKLEQHGDVELLALLIWIGPVAVTRTEMPAENASQQRRRNLIIVVKSRLRLVQCV